MAPTATSKRVAVHPTACCRSNASRVRPFAALRGASRAGDGASATCTQHAERRALKLPLLPPLAGAAADGTHRNLHARGGPSDGVLPFKSACACTICVASEWIIKQSDII